MVIKSAGFGFLVKCGRWNTGIYICSLTKIKVKEYKRGNGGPQMSTHFWKISKWMEELAELG